MLKKHMIVFLPCPASPLSVSQQKEYVCSTKQDKTCKTQNYHIIFKYTDSAIWHPEEQLACLRQHLIGISYQPDCRDDIYSPLFFFLW